jgi:hypothetical protein
MDDAKHNLKDPHTFKDPRTFKPLVYPTHASWYAIFRRIDVAALFCRCA